MTAAALSVWLAVLARAGIGPPPRSQPVPTGSTMRLRSLRGGDTAATKVLSGGGGGGQIGRVQRVLAGDVSLFREDSASAFALWAASAAVYLGTLRWADARVASAPTQQPPLVDLGFERIPRLDALAYFTDVLGTAMGLWVACAFFWGSAPQQEAARHGIVNCGVGNLFSASLHTFTIMPSAEYAGTELPMMGGRSDKLMSNHAFCVGLTMQMLVKLRYVPGWAMPVGVALYSAAMLSTRAHYSVDIILAWWALAVTHYIGA